MSNGHSYFSHLIPFLYGDSVGGYIKQFFLPIGKCFKENPSYYTRNILFFLFPNMLICPSGIFFSTNVILLGQVPTLKRCFLVCLSTYPTNTPRGFHVETTWKQLFPRRFNVESMWSVCRVVVEEISRNKSAAQTPITDFINEKENHVSIRHKIILTLMKFISYLFLSIDIMYMIYLDVKYFSVVCLSIYYEKPAIKTTLTTMGHFFEKKLSCCPSEIICNSVALKCQCLKQV